MTILTGKLTSIGGHPWGGPGHSVVIFSRLTRPGPNGTVILELRDRIPMTTHAGGEFTSTDMEPGPIRVELEGGELHGQAWDLVLPDPPEGNTPVELADLINLQFEWTPGFVSRTEAAARRAEEARDKAVASEEAAALSEQSAGNDAYTAEQAAASAQGDAEQTAQDRQHIDGVRDFVDDASAAAIAAAGTIQELWEQGGGGGVSLVEDPPGSGLFVIGA